MVDSSKIEYVKSGQLIAATYVKNSKAIGFLWGIFSICYSIVTLVVFVQPQWIGSSGAHGGYIGLWKHCMFSLTSEVAVSRDGVCLGRLDDLGSLLNPALKVATGFVAIATLISALSVFALILFICTPTTVAYHIVAWMQTVSALAIVIGLLVFPLGWDAPEVKQICGNADRFHLGSCSIRWAYILAIIAAMDGMVLAVLGFVLGSKHVKLIDEVNSTMKHSNNSHPYHRRFMYPSESDLTPSVSMSYGTNKRSLSLQPIVLIPPDHDEYSDFSRSKNSLHRAEYSSSQRFQL